MKKEIINPISFMPLSAIENPAALVEKPGDYLLLKVTKSGRRVAKLNAGGVKRAMVRYPGGKTVETVAHR